MGLSLHGLYKFVKPGDEFGLNRGTSLSRGRVEVAVLPLVFSVRRWSDPVSYVMLVVFVNYEGRGAPGLVRLLNAALESVLDFGILLLRSNAFLTYIHRVTFLRCFSLLPLGLL